MKKILLWVRLFFIKKSITKIEVGSVVRFKAIIGNVTGVVKKIKDSMAKVAYLDYGSSQIVNWLPIKKLELIW